VSFDPLPSWLSYQGAPLSGTLGNGKTRGFELIQKATYAPLSSQIGFTFSALTGTGGTFSKQIFQLQVAVVPTDKLQPVGPSPGPDTDPSDFPLLVSNKLSPGGIALLLLSLLFIIISFVLYMQGTLIQNLAFRNMP
jgi:hypothetical protein